MGKILLPLNFNWESHATILSFAEFAKRMSLEGHLILLHTFLLPATSPARAVNLHDDTKKKSIAMLESEKKYFMQNAAGLKITSEIMSCMGTLENVIGNLAQGSDVDFIVLGHNQETNRCMSAPGGCQSFLKRVECPVLVFPLVPPK